MTRKLVLAIALSALTVTACGSKNGYKAAQFNKASYPLAEELNQRASRDIEVNALKLIMADELFVSSKDNVLSNALKQEILGLSAKVTLGDKAVIEVSKLDDKAVDCKEKTTKAEIDKSSTKSLNRINNFGRVACVDDNCENIVVLMETRRNVKTEENTNGSVIDGSVAILLKKDASGLHKPLTTESTEFLQINAVDVATATCLELVAEQEAEKQMEKVQQEVDKNPSSDQAIRNQKQNSVKKKLQKEIDKNPSSDEAIRNQKQHAAQMEKVQKEIDKKPSLDEAIRNQNERLAQNDRLKAIDDRIKAIDARQIELSKSSTKTDEPKALATERAQLIKERDGILAPRNLPKVDTVEPQPEAVDPT